MNNFTHSQTNKRLIIGGLLVGLPGIVAVVLLILPLMLSGKPIPLPMWAVQLISMLQSAVLLAIAVFAGTKLAPKLGLRTPVLSAWASHLPIGPALRAQIEPGVIGGLLGALVIWLFALNAPSQILQLQSTVPAMPALARVLYGGITEELLIRWGFMSLVVWVMWRLFQKERTTPTAIVMWTSILLSTLLFGIGHLPAASAMIGDLSNDTVVFVILGNAAFGIIAGWLYWKRGLEAAIIAHILTHLVLIAVGK